MKKLLIFILVLQFNMSNAQTLGLTAEDSIHGVFTVNSIDDSFEHKVYVKNGSFSLAKVIWEIDSIYSPSEWDVSFCDIVNCYDVAQISSDTFPLASNGIGFLKMGYSPNATSGTSYVSINLVPVNTTDTVITVIYTTDIDVDIPDAISTFETTTISIYPNPTISFINVNVEGSESIQKIVIYNVIGKVVEEVNTTSSMNTINVKNYDNGLYIIKLFGENDTLFHTQTFVKK